MNLKPLLSCLLAAFVAITATPVAAQGLDIGEMVDRSLAAMNAGSFEEAHHILTEAVNSQGGNAQLHYQVHGPRFGLLHYRKGLCEVRLGKWEDAMNSFEICYRDFPNDEARPANRNAMRTLALLRWAEAAMGAQNWQLAVDQFKKFDAEKLATDRFNRGRFHTDLATSHYNLGQIPEGNENLEIAINNKVAFDTPETSIMAAFQALVTAAIEKKNEQALVDFIQKNRAGLTISPFRMHQFLQVFLRLAGDSFNAGMQNAAIAIYQLVPSTDVALADARATLASLGEARGLSSGGETLVAANIETTIEQLETLLENPTSPETIKLAAIAFIHEDAGNVRGAHAAYRQLEDFHSHAEKREENLYNLVRTSSILGEINATEIEARKFLSTFPDSPYVPAVRRLMLSSLFFNGEYDSCIQIAEPMLPTLEEGTPEHDLCLHVLGGSFFYTGEFDKARPLLDQHVEKYPESPFVIAARYFQASNESRLQFWQRAARLLDEFLNTYPDPEENIYLPFALFDRATTHYAEDQNEAALAILNRLIEEFSTSAVIDMTYNLRGNILQSDDDLVAADESYLKALEIAEKTGNSSVAGEALYYLVNVSAEQMGDQPEDPFAVRAIEFAERFWNEFAETSPFQTQVAVVQMKPLGNLGRYREGLDRLQSVISEMARIPEAIGLEEAINSYTEAYLVEFSLEDLREHYYNFPGIRVADSAARALLRIAVIGAYEDAASKEDDQARRSAYQATVRALFQELKSDFNPTVLTNFILVRVGDYLRNNTSTPRESLPYYDEVLGRTDQSYRFDALLGRADVFGNSTNPEDLAKAIEDFVRIYDDSQDRGQREFALYRLVEIHLGRGEYDKTIARAREYLDRDKNNFSRYSGQVGLHMAMAFDRSGKTNDALVRYGTLWTGNMMGSISVSAPAIKRWMEIHWEMNRPASGNNPSDRQGAYNGGKQYITLTERLRDKMTPEELTVWDEVAAMVRTYEANPNIEPKDFSNP